MFVLRDPELAGRIADPGIRSLVAQRFAEVCAGEAYDYDLHGYMIVVEPGDSVEAIEEESCCPILRNLFDDARYGGPEFSPCFEALETHDACYEMLFITNDDGFGITLFIPKAEGIDADLLAMCAEYATPAIGVPYLPYVKPRKRSWKRDDELYTLRIKAVFGHRRLNQITRQQIQSFHTDLLTQGLAPATCDHHVKLLKHALFLAIDWGLLTEKNPAARIPLFNRDNKVEHYLDDDQLEKLLTVLRTDDNKAICQIAMFLLSTGCRLNEALRATWSEVDKQNRVWRIPASNSKSKRIRSVPLNDSALDILNQLATEGKFDSVFVNLRTEEAYTTIHKVWDRLRGKAGLPHLRIHDLRHMYASFLVNSGRTLYEVQSILGHSDAKVTQRYAHLSSKSLQSAANSASLMIKGAMRVPTSELAAEDVAVAEGVAAEAVAAEVPV